MLVFPNMFLLLLRNLENNILLSNWQKFLSSFRNIFFEVAVTNICVKKKMRTQRLRKQKGNHVIELSASSHGILEWHWKCTFDFTEIVNNLKFKQETVSKYGQIIRFVFSKISYFSLKLHKEF